MENILIGIDGGGTKTEFCVHDSSTGTDTFFTFESTNYKNIGEKTATEHFKHAVDQVFDKTGLKKDDIKGLVLGAAGYDTIQDETFYQNLVKTLKLDSSKIYICNDCDMVLLSQNEFPCICIVAGTGSIAVGYGTDKKKSRSGGWGSHLSDEGSGYWIARKVLSDCLLYVDGIAPKKEITQKEIAKEEITQKEITQKEINQKEITQKVMDHFGCKNKDELPYILTLLDTAGIASLAKIIIESNDDAYCVSIMNKAIEQLVGLAVSVASKLEINGERPITVVLTGSLFKSDYFREKYISAFNDKIKQETKFVFISERPSKSGALLAKNIF